ncbi:GIY-YIG nuclease family protein [Sulfuritalea hydrogenivorans]|jgi:putative endonuclease|uniref:Excinuclease ABC subunit C n=1 Tax=Sulfuritalea hydrogenivorans sk43H TaxID=1223802 RepID=W0SGK7_9PROT|nr:GIY-YIG nuclease family protein [Sulfuritalea hydrogenivorans]MDK9712607.1 GIY-YIG nuclease family protein [Sulfuritalea sp.]BAO29890.1 excinuclease ABC subunit C [Sulfuritalea hydrogenivorans sk43H]
MSAHKTWFVYLIECTDGCLYTGITVNLESRFKAHVEGRGARYMRLHPPLRMLAAEAHPDRAAASKAEYRIKQLSSAEKRAYAARMTAGPLPPSTLKSVLP